MMKLETGKKYYVVRNRQGVDPLPADWRENPTDFVFATYLGQSEDDVKDHIFDDGQLAKMLFLCIEPSDVSRFVYEGNGDEKIKAIATAKEEGERLALWYAREDHAIGSLLLAIIGADAKAVKVACEEAPKEAVKGAGRFLGISGKVSATELVISLREMAKDAKKVEVASAKAKGMVNRTERVHGVKVKTTNEQAHAEDHAEEVAEEKAKKEAKKAEEKKSKAVKTSKPKGEKKAEVVKKAA